MTPLYSLLSTILMSLAECVDFLLLRPLIKASNWFYRKLPPSEESLQREKEMIVMVKMLQSPIVRETFDNLPERDIFTFKNNIH